MLSNYPGRPHQIAHAVGLDALALVEAPLSDLRVAGFEHHELSRTPCHAYVAFHVWLRQQSVDAVIHMCAHATFEWLPGKSVALSPCCLPEAFFEAIRDEARAAGLALAAIETCFTRLHETSLWQTRRNSTATALWEVS